LVSSLKILYKRKEKNVFGLKKHQEELWRFSGATKASWFYLSFAGTGNYLPEGCCWMLEYIQMI